MARKPKPYIKDKIWYCTSVGGVQHQKLCLVAAGLKAAELALARLLVQLDEAPSPSLTGGIPTIAQACETFLDMKKVETSQGTYEWYQAKLVPFFEQFARRQARSIEYEDGLRFKRSLMESGLANSTINSHIRAAKTLLAWIAKPSRRKKYLAGDNPWQEILYLTEKPRERLITDQELAALLSECCDGNVVGGALDFREQVFTMRYTTMRPGELRRLKWEYIEWDNHRVVYPPEVIKTRNRREFTLIDRVRVLLEERLKRLVGVDIDKPSGYVFPLPGRDPQGRHNAMYPSGRLQKSRSFTHRWQRLFKRCVKKGLIEKTKGGETIVPYSTRHSRITELVLEDHPTPVVMSEAGHSSPNTTQRYTHLAGSVVASRIRAADDKRVAKQQQEPPVN